MGWTIDDELSDQGQWQAHRLSQRLSRLPIAAIYSSPLRRALSTARIVASAHSLPVETVEGLGEMRLGAWEGLFAHEIAASYPELWRMWRRDPSGIQMPGGESLAQVRERAVAAFKQIVEANQGSQVTAVTHDVVIRLLVAYCLDVSTAIYRRLQVDNASLTIVVVSDGNCRLCTLNDTAHLVTH